MLFTVPSVADFKAKFFRDFPYGTTLDTVQDIDISNAMDMVVAQFNEDLVDSQSIFTLCYLLFSAHNLVLNLRASSQGISGQYSWLQSSKSVGSVSEGFSIPQRILDNPEFAMLTKTHYGAQFLYLVLPRLSGQIFIVGGTTNP